MSANRMTEADLLEMLKARYAGDAFAFVPKVRSSTGYANAVRTADAVVMGLWPSRGLELMGFEIKCSRKDWLRELKDPSKAEVIARFCDRWWIVVAGDGIIAPGELPGTWGLLMPRGKALRCVKEAPKLDPEPPADPFLAALLRAATAVARAGPEEIQAAYREGYESGERSGAINQDRWQREAERLREITDAFQKHSGIEMSRFGHLEYAEKVGEAVRLVLEGDRSTEHLRRRLEDIARQARAVAEQAEAALEPGEG